MGSEQQQVFEALTEFIERHSERIALAVVYGSFAAGTYRATSDADLYYPGLRGFYASVEGRYRSHTEPPAVPDPPELRAWLAKR